MNFFFFFFGKGLQAGRNGTLRVVRDESGGKQGPGCREPGTMKRIQLGSDKITSILQNIWLTRGRLTNKRSRQGDQLGDQIRRNAGMKQDKKQKPGYQSEGQSIRMDDFQNFPIGNIIHSWEYSFHYLMEQLICIKLHSSVFFFHGVAFGCCCISFLPIRCTLSRI